MQRQLATGQSSILPVNIEAKASLIQEIFMEVVNFSHSSYLAAVLSPLRTLATWLTQPASRKQLVPPANAPLAYQRLTLPFARPRSSHCTHAVARVSSFKSPAMGSKDPAVTRLKVVREQDAAVSPACAGRMTISGRMADVCAELERMAQRQAAL
jgi:hypothetical protein